MLAKLRRTYSKAKTALTPKTNSSKLLAVIIVLVLLISVSFQSTDGFKDKPFNKTNLDSGAKSKAKNNAELVETAAVESAGGANLSPYISGVVDTAVGKTPPKFTGRSFTSTDTTTVGEPSQVTVFLSHWCTTCKEDYKALNDFLAKNKTKNVKVVLVVTSTSESQANYPPSEAFKDFRGEVFLDDTASSTARAWGTPSFPFVVVTNKAGTVAERHAGALDEKLLETLTKAAKN